MSETIVELSAQNFGSEVLQSKLPVVVDFWTAWCGPCKTVAPVLDELAAELKGTVRFAKVDAESNQEIALRFRVSSFPTFILFKDGQMVDRALGAMGKGQFQKFINRNM
ncbi:MAG: thioredoxin [Acidobacteriota bacterium]